MVRPNPHHYVLGASLAPATLEDHIKYCLRAAILTHLGERSQNRQLGSRIRDLLFKPLFPGLRVEIETEIRRAVASAEPRIEVEQVQIAADPTEATRITVVISYRVRQTRKQDQMRVRL